MTDEPAQRICPYFTKEIIGGDLIYPILIHNDLCSGEVVDAKAGSKGTSRKPVTASPQPVGVDRLERQLDKSLKKARDLLRKK